MTAAGQERDCALYETVTLLVCSAPLALDETRLLSAYRMLDAADRLMGIMADHDDDFPRRARADFAAHRMLAMTDQAAFTDWMAGYVAGFAAQALRRTRAAGV
ncbi:DUF6092 family protein [Nonomuraea sp. NPDC050394]|uniref:DUF6092 family protein n=1 Tax=Nonomuraea sp. NPDC050394 TaxID=3364363 RepID=UPI0037BB164B